MNTTLQLSQTSFPRATILSAPAGKVRRLAPVGRPATLFLGLAAICLAGLIIASPAPAQTNGVWSQANSGGLWSNPADWQGGNVASGTGATADFSQLTLPGNNTVHLDTSETVGSLLFADLGNTYNWTLDNNSSSGNVLTLAVSSGSPTITVDNDTATISAALAGTQGLTVYGGAPLWNSDVRLFGVIDTSNVATNGTLVLNPSVAEGYSGSTTVTSGTLTLDFTNMSTPTNLVSSGSGLVLAGGALGINDQPGAAATSQTFNGTTLNAGGGSISVNVNGSTNGASVLALGAITRNVAGGAVNLTLPAIGNITTTTANNAGGTLGGWTTVGGINWAVNSGVANAGGGNNIAALATYQNDNYATSTNNVSVTTADSPSSVFTINSLRFNAPGTTFGGNVLSLPSGNSTINTGGILVTPNVSFFGATIYSSSSSNVLQSGNSQSDLIINQFDPNGTLYVNAFLSNSDTVTKTGPGTMFINSTPLLNLDQGIVAVGSAFPNVAFMGNGTVQIISSGTLISRGADAMTIASGATATIDDDQTGESDTLALFSFSGGGSLAFTSSNGTTTTILNLENNTTTAPGSSYAGTTTIYGGQIRLAYIGTGVGNANKLNPNQPLYLGGVLSIAPSTTAGTPTVQTYSSNLDLIANSASGIYQLTTVASGTVLSITGSTGGIVRASGSTVAFGLQDTTDAKLTIGSGASNSSLGMLGGWAVYGSATSGNFAQAVSFTATDWAGLNGSNQVVSLTSAGGSYATNTWSSGSNTDITTSGPQSFAGSTNSVRFNPSDAAGTYTINLTSAGSIASGGILLPTSSSAVAAVISGSSISSGNGQDLIVNDYNVTSGASTTFQSQITGSIGLTLSGNTQATTGSGGLIILNNSSNNNNYTGATAIDAAITLQIGVTSSAGQQLPTGSAVVLSQRGILNLNGNNQSIGSLTSVSFGTIVDGNASSGNVTLTVGNDNTSTTFNGQLRNVAGNGTGPTLALVKVGSGTLTLGDDGGAYGAPVSLGPGGGGGGNYNYPFSTYVGGTTVDNGTLSIVADICLGATTSTSAVSNIGAVTLSAVGGQAGTLQATGTFNSARNFFIGPSGGSGVGNIDVVSPYVLTLTSPVANSAGAVSGGLTKVDAGTLALSNNTETYTGVTTVAGGTLEFVATNNNNVAGSAGIDVKSGAKLDVSQLTSGNLTLASGQWLMGEGNINGSVTVPSGGRLNPGEQAILNPAATESIGTLTSNALTLASGSLLTYEFDGNDLFNTTNSNGLTINGGAFTLYQEGTTNPFDTPGTYQVLGFAGSVQGTGISALSVANQQAGFTYSFSIDPNGVDVDLTIAAVPEPASLALAGLGLAGLGLFARRRRRSCRSI